MNRNACLPSALALLALAPLAQEGRPPESAPTNRNWSKGLVERPLERALFPSNVASAVNAANPPAAGLVHWHADFDAACAAARTSGKAVLLLQLLGRLDDDSCCAIARLARDVLLSNPKIAAFLNAEFECAWESVRPAPRLKVDFGTGSTLQRTLDGNLVTYFCTADGEVFDLLPGLVDEREYAWRLDSVVRLVESARMLLPPAPAIPNRARAPSAAPTRPFIDAQRLREAARQTHELRLVMAQRGQTLGWEPGPRLIAVSKFRVEHRLELEVLRPVDFEAAATFQRETSINRTRFALASQLLLERPFERPSALTHEAFLRVLGVDLDDPYLGLAPSVIGGELGRH